MGFAIYMLGMLLVIGAFVYGATKSDSATHGSGSSPWRCSAWA